MVEVLTFFLTRVHSLSICTCANIADLMNRAICLYTSTVVMSPQQSPANRGE